MDRMEKRILDSLVVILKLERNRTDELIAKAMPADQTLIPKLTIATIKLGKSGIREYCNNLLHRKSKLVVVQQIQTPKYMKGLD
jgi:hypothetical protein